MTNIAGMKEHIRVLAYRLWKEAGSPENRSGEFWVMAQKQLAGEAGTGSNVVPPGGQDLI
ncbi:DUF2934 domain-containing protein [Caballeronia sp. INDeC2]|uniref:DUF2934 domain-containing protein n=1 Tax=Caballeronia sp. INDeC2 TaxID=2921747 RepID=UPI0020281671|nr:DUF2934 domain-containing protein [Caballeronia sp. INDeC2]